MSDNKKNTSDVRFTLDVRIPKKIPQRVDVVDVIHLGADPRNDIIISNEEGSSSKQFTFRVRSNALVGINLNANGKKILLNQTPMQEGKHYILEKGDSINLNEVEIIIRQGSTSSLAKGLDQSSPNLKFLDGNKKEVPVLPKNIKTPEPEVEPPPIEKPVEVVKKPGFFDKLKKLFKKQPKTVQLPPPKRKKPKSQ